MTSGFQCSPQQQRLIALQKSLEGQPFWVQGVVTIKGSICKQKLDKCLNLIVQKHEILRTSFQVFGDSEQNWSQVIVDACEVLIDEFATEHCKQYRQLEDFITDILREHRQKPVLGHQAPLLRIALLSLSQNQHMLLLSLPSICGDIATLKNFVRELTSIYSDSEQKNTLEVMHYADVAAWQNELSLSEDVHLARAYWQKQNVSSLNALKLPYERYKSDRSYFEPQFITLELKSRQVKALKLLSQNDDLGLQNLLLASWLVLCWHLTKQPHLIVGVAFENRQLDELKNVFGLLTKYLPVSAQFTDQTSFREIVNQVNAATKEARKWQEYFDWKQLNIPDSEPFCFPYSFEFIKLPAQPASEDGNTVFSLTQVNACIELAKLKLVCTLKGDNLSLGFHYEPKYFESKYIHQIAEQFQALLTDVVLHPDALIYQLNILSDKEWQQLIVTSNQTATKYASDKCVHHLFEEQATSFPNRLAVTYGNQSLTYGELNARSNKLAQYLQSMGVTSEVLVAICVERSLEMIVGLLAILKAGGAYVPLDPSYPQDRLAFMLYEIRFSYPLCFLV